MWTMLQIILGLLGLLLALGGDKLSMAALTYIGVALMGLASMAIGWEAIITRHIVVGSRHLRATYTGAAAIAQGIQFNMLGLFLISVSIAAYLNTGRATVLHFVRRPGLPLLIFGVYCLLQSMISISGSIEEKHDARWIVMLNLLVSRLLPGVILFIIGLGTTGLGLFEIVAPTVFDDMGGGFLEVLYGVK